MKRDNPLFRNTTPQNRSCPTTLHLDKASLVALDRTLLNLLERHDARLTRSSLIRALINILDEMDVHFDGKEIRLERRA